MENYYYCFRRQDRPPRCDFLSFLPFFFLFFPLSFLSLLSPSYLCSFCRSCFYVDSLFFLSSSMADTSAIRPIHLYTTIS